MKKHFLIAILRLFSLISLFNAMDAFCATLEAPPVAQAPTNPVVDLYDFGKTKNDPVIPRYIGLIAVGPDGNLYSTSEGGGEHGLGTVFKLTPKGDLTILWSFSGKDGFAPESGLSLGSDGAFYGTTNGGGKYASGTIFRITASGNLTTIWDFRNGKIVPPLPYPQQPSKQQILDAAGSFPLSGPVQGPDGYLYGVVPTGNIQQDGIFYRITPGGNYQGLHNFHDNLEDYPCAIILGKDGDFYGTTLTGRGTYRYGSVFKATPDGDVSIIYQFDPAHGSQPYNIIEGDDNCLYGTTNLGGQTTRGNPRGTIYKLTLSGDITTLHVFSGDGESPTAGVVQGKDGLLYGVASFGGPYQFLGDFYRLKTDGTAFTILSGFGGPYGGVGTIPPVQLSDGKFYGFNAGGGAFDDGVFYSLDPNAPTVTSVRLDQPELKTNGKLRSLVQTVYALGAGRGPVSGKWYLDGAASVTMPARTVDLSSGDWLPLGTFNEHLTGHHSLQFVVDGPKAPRTSVEDVAITNFIPSVDGWSFQNVTMKYSLAMKLTPLVLDTNDYDSRMQSNHDGACEGFVISARDYFNNYPVTIDRPPGGEETLPIDNLIYHDYMDGNAFRKEYDAPQDYQHALFFPQDPVAYKSTLLYEAAQIQGRIQNDDPCVIDMYRLQSAPNIAFGGHAVLGDASFYSTNMLKADSDGGMSEIDYEYAFSIYDPNYPDEDDHWVGAYEYANSMGIPQMEFNPAKSDFYSTLLMWAPNTFHPKPPVR